MIKECNIFHKRLFRLECQALKTTAADRWLLLPEGAIISFPRLLRRTQRTVREIKQDSSKLATTEIQMLCFAITEEISRLLLRGCSIPAECEDLLLCPTELVDLLVPECSSKVEVWVPFSRSSPIISWETLPSRSCPEFVTMALLAFCLVRGCLGRRVPWWLLGMIGNPRWSSGTGPAVFLRLVDQPKKGRLRVVATVGTPVVVRFCLWVTLAVLKVWLLDTSRLTRRPLLTIQEAKGI